MTLLFSCQSISKSHGSRQLFKDISFGIFRGDRIGLIGPNGSGKSTFLKILAGLEPSDEGVIAANRHLRIGYVPQESVFFDKSLEEIVIDSLDQDTTLDLPAKRTQALITLGKLGFLDPSQKTSSLSGGWKKRLEMAKELAKSPDLLLLDEPTNHLDLEGLLWLEKFLQSASFSYIVVSHDRYFLENVSTRMMELNKSYPKGLFSIEGPYSVFLEKREEFLNGQIQQERSLTSKVRRELEWLKQNPKARTTKSQSRIQEAQRLIQDLNQVKTRNIESKNQINFSSSARQMQKMLVATNIGKSLGGRELFSHLHFTLSPGMRLGIIGLNGSGKTTLLRILAGELPPDQGTIKYAENLSIVYFDQHRIQLPSDLSLRRALAPVGDTVNYKGKSIHINSWCKRFLFDPNRLDLPFGQLSGGEKARVHIARFMLKPADILLLDEPTNDLDLPTLEILEESLLDFPGAIVLISHDRYMLDQITNVILSLGIGSDTTLFADYRQWEELQSLQKQKKVSSLPSITLEKRREMPRSKVQSNKMTYLEKQEWEQMEEKILEVEQEIARQQEQLTVPAISSHPSKLQEICQKLDAKQSYLDHLYKRWAELEIKAMK